MPVFLVNPSDVSFGTAVITPRWLYVLAAATPSAHGDPTVVDETIEPLDLDAVRPGDVVGIGIHTSNAFRGYTLGRLARERGAHVVFGGIHATLFPDEAHEHGAAHSVVRGDGDVVWSEVLEDCAAGRLKPVYEGGLPFCSVWRTDGQQPRQRLAGAVVQEVMELRRLGFRFILLADDNFYPVTLEDLRQAGRRSDQSRLEELQALRAERFDLMEQLARLPDDFVFYTQITMEAAEDPEFLDAMRKAHIRGALVGVESVTPEGLKAVFKNFNDAGEALVDRLQAFRTHGIQILGSFIFGLPTDKADTFQATANLAQRAGVSFAQVVMLTPFPGTLDMLISKLYRQMYANTGIATDSARTNRSARWARWLARPCRRLFVTDPVPDLPNAGGDHAHTGASRRTAGGNAVPSQLIRSGQTTREIR
jgi:radical SAM superfamily enzyme YgiQ (UPF0313 family)